MSVTAIGAGSHRSRIVFLGGGPPHIGLFVADVDGQHETPFLPSGASDYNPSFSTDGKWIVFTSDRAGSADVYRVRPDGTALERLTDSPAFDDQGVLSPDGQTLAFISSRDGGMANLWLLDLRRHKYFNVTRSRSGNFRPSWSPDGEWIAFTSDRDMPHKRSGPDKPPPEGSGCCGWEMVQSTALYIVRPDGSGLRRLTAVDGFAGSPEWSSDGKHVVFYNERSQIAQLDVESGQQKDLTSGPGRKWSPQYADATKVRYLTGDQDKFALTDTSGSRGPPGDIWNPSWSPDGQRVIFARSSWDSGPESDLITKIATGDPEFDLYRAVGYTLSWSPDGRKVLRARPFVGDSKLQVVNSDGSSLQTLYETKDPEKGIVFPVWTPDGEHIVFTLGRYGSRNPVTPAQLAQVRADGSEFKLLTRSESGSGYPSLSPDGKRLVFRMLGSEQGLRILSLESGEIATLTTESDNFPGWSPRGDRIVFTSLRSGDFEIYTIRPDGSGLRQLTKDHGNNAHSVWSPDGKQIVFTSTRSGWKDETRLPSNYIQSNGELVVMRSDGSHRRQLTDDQYEQAAIGRQPSAR